MLPTSATVNKINPPGYILSDDLKRFFKQNWTVHFYHPLRSMGVLRGFQFLSNALLKQTSWFAKVFNHQLLLAWFAKSIFNHQSYYLLGLQKVLYHQSYYCLVCKNFSIIKVITCLVCKGVFIFLTVLGFNDTSTLVGHFVSSPRKREKRDRRDSRRDEREGQGRKRNRNESEETEEIKTSSPYPYLLQW